MNASAFEELPPGSPPMVSASVVSQTILPRSRFRVFLLATAITLAMAVALLIWWWARPAPLVIPLPDDLGDLEVREAIAQARQEVQRNPTAATWGHLGMVFTANDFDPEATFCFKTASQLDPGDSRWLYYQGTLGLRSEKDKTHEQAINLFHQAVKANSWPQYAFSMRMKLVELLLERNQLEQAEALLRDLNPQDQNSVRVAMNLGWIAMARGETARAQDYFSRASASNHLRKKATTQLALLARLANDTKEAERLDKEAAHMKKDEPWPDPLVKELQPLIVGQKLRTNTIRKLEFERKYQEAAALYLQQLETDPDLENHLGAGMNLARCRDYDRALPLLREAVHLDPQSDRAQFSLAVTLFRRAEEHRLQHPQSKEDDDAFREVVEHASLAAHLKPDHALACLICGTALKYLGRMEESILPLRRGIASQPNNIDLQVTLAEVFFELGKYDEAQSQLDAAIQLDAKYPPAVHLLERLRSKKTKDKFRGVAKPG